MKGHTRARALAAAFPVTIPVMLGYLFVGMAFGLLLQNKGYNFLWALLMSVCVYAGSMQFVAINFLTGGFSLVTVALMTAMINARHLFYGLTMLDRYSGIEKKKRRYMIFALTDETYSLYCANSAPPGVDGDCFFFFIALLNQLYWIVGSVVGSLAGALVPFNTKGIDFAMTALFLVILTDQLRASRSLPVAAIGGACSLLCLILFGPDGFILPSMGLIVLALLVLRGPLARTLPADRGERA